MSYFILSDRDISRVLSFIKIKHNGEIGRLDLTSSGLVKVAINAVTLALCYFDISVAVVCVYSVWAFALFWFHRALLFGVFAILVCFARVNGCAG